MYICISVYMYICTCIYNHLMLPTKKYGPAPIFSLPPGPLKDAFSIPWKPPILGGSSGQARALLPRHATRVLKSWHPRDVPWRHDKPTWDKKAGSVERISGWWFQPPWKILVNWDDDIPNRRKNLKECSSHHQPDMNWWPHWKILTMKAQLPGLGTRCIIVSALHICHGPLWGLVFSRHYKSWGYHASSW